MNLLDRIKAPFLWLYNKLFEALLLYILKVKSVSIRYRIAVFMARKIREARAKGDNTAAQAAITNLLDFLNGPGNLV